ncbi:Muscle M-line assembly protein unc-89 Uncoordinated protein 89 [Salmonella enterica subsp. enterica serovar Heidelberg]|nr:Muscle M-line assembly protein unc-89 Uncoordinated protein 89 [Salmonella enterica subsp. enterica serovar Heidelberg]
MRLLAVVSKLTGVSTTVESSAVTLNAPSIVKLSVAREEISQLTRINQDLVVTLHSGETITIKKLLRYQRSGRKPAGTGGKRWHVMVGRKSASRATF